MLTGFITSQRDHGGYLCIGSNNSLSLQESWHLPPFSISHAGQTRSSLARMTTPPCLPSSLALLLFLPFFHFTHLQPEGLRKEMESRAQLSQQHRSQSPRLQTFNIHKRLAPTYVSTEQHLHGDNYNRGSASGRGPTRGDQRHWRLKKKTTETETCSSLARVYACVIPGWSIPGKIWMSTNQIRVTATGAHVSRELCARALSHLGVYKESPVAYRAIRVRVS